MADMKKTNSPVANSGVRLTKNEFIERVETREKSFYGTHIERVHESAKKIYLSETAHDRLIEKVQCIQANHKKSVRWGTVFALALLLPFSIFVMFAYPEFGVAGGIVFFVLVGLITLIDISRDENYRQEKKHFLEVIKALNDRDYEVYSIPIKNKTWYFDSKADCGFCLECENVNVFTYPHDYDEYTNEVIIIFLDNAAKTEIITNENQAALSMVYLEADKPVKQKLQKRIKRKFYKIVFTVSFVLVLLSTVVLHTIGISIVFGVALRIWATLLLCAIVIISTTILFISTCCLSIRFGKKRGLVFGYRIQIDRNKNTLTKLLFAIAKPTLRILIAILCFYNVFFTFGVATFPAEEYEVFTSDDGNTYVVERIHRDGEEYEVGYEYINRFVRGIDIKKLVHVQNDGERVVIYPSVDS